MKKAVFMIQMALCLFMFAACSSDNNSDNDSQQPVSLSSLFGTWESDGFFLSLNSVDKFYSAYIDDGFIDCGQFAYDERNMRITCDNQFFSSKTSYQIASYDRNSMTTTVTYTDWRGSTHTKSLTFRKTQKSASVKDEITGKAWSEQWLDGNEESFKTYNLTSFNSGDVLTDNKDANNYPMKLFYVYYDNTMYYQLFNQKEDAPFINGWNTDAGTGKVLTKILRWR